GDLLRRAVRTPDHVLPGPRTLNARQTLRLLPGVDREGLLGGILSFDGQLVDDARLVVGLARTAAREGARVLTRCSAEVVTATGVHADTLDPTVRLSPSRGTHLVLDGATMGDPKAALTVPLPGSWSRFVFALPQPCGRVFAGLTDEPLDGPAPRVPEAPEEDVDFLLRRFNRVLGTKIGPKEVLGTYAGVRPLVHKVGGGTGADLSREHVIVESGDGMVTVVGGKLTTYRAMAEEAVDRAI